MLRLTAASRHVPLIRFRYAIAKSGSTSQYAAKSVREYTAANAAAKGVRGPAERTVHDYYDQLPAHLRPKVFSDVEIETVTLGGAEPYVPKHLLKKKKK